VNATAIQQRYLAVLCALAALTTPTPVGAEPALEGRWIGGFRGRDAVVAVEVTFPRGGTDAPAALDVPRRGEHGIALKNLRVKKDRVSFELPAAEYSMLFEGRIGREGRIEGSVRQGPSGYSSFELLKVVTPSPSDMRGIYGTYRWAQDKVLLVAPSNGGVIYVDYDSGRTGTLYAVGRDRFVGGPTMGTGYPVAIDLTFERDASGVATQVTLAGEGRTVQAQRTRFYDQEEVAFASGDEIIAGTLLRPATPGPHPALVMIHGSGPVTRDALRPFADHFARNGIAVLITDKRGTGRSTGTWARATFDDLAQDALAGVRMLRGRADIDPSAIGLHGVSLGGWVAPLAASRSRDVAYVVVESAPTLTPREHERLRVESQLRADAFPREDIARALAFMDLKLEVARTGEGWARLQSLMDDRPAWLSYVNPPSSLDSLRWHWDHVFGYDPIPVLERLRVPMLVLYGALDSIVPPRVHRARMQQAIEAAGRHDVTIKVFDKANHGFFEAITGGRLEQPGLASFVDGYFEERTAWVLATVQDVTARVTEEIQD
jgi:dienelactone hydrolase